MNKQTVFFHVLIMDHDQKLIALRGPVFENSAINADVAKAKGEGRNVSATTIARPSRVLAEADARRFKAGYRLVDEVL